MKLDQIVYPSELTANRPSTHDGSRHSVSIPCRFYSPHGHYEGYLRNLSTGGAFVETDRIPPVETSGNLTFRSPDGRELEITAHVAHTLSTADGKGGREGFGLCFVSLHTDSLNRLKQLLYHLEA